MLLELIKLDSDERVLKTIRRHWFVIASELFGLFILALIPLVVWIFLSVTVEDNAYITTVKLTSIEPYFIFMTAAWLLVLTMAGAAAWTHYYLDHWIVTNKRVMLIDQRGFFWRSISSFRLERLQELSVEINGLIPTLLNFGTIRAETAGENNSEFVTSGMPDPRGIKAMIVEAADRLSKNQSSGTSNGSQGL